MNSTGKKILLLILVLLNITLNGLAFDTPKDTENFTIDEETLAQKQAFVQLLLENPELLATIEKSLTKLKDLESSFLWLWQASPLFNTCYFKTQNLNVLECASIWKSIGSPMMLTLAIPLTILAYFYFCYYLMKQEDCARGLESGLFGKFLCDIIKSYSRRNKFYNGMGSVFLIETMLLEIMATHEGISHANEYNKTSTFIHEKMIDIASFVSIISELNKLLIQNTKYAKLFDQTNKHSENFNKLTTLLKTKTFTGKPSFFSFRGLVLAAFKIMLEVKEEFAIPLKNICQLDALVTQARFFKPKC